MGPCLIWGVITVVRWLNFAKKHDWIFEFELSPIDGCDLESTGLALTNYSRFVNGEASAPLSAITNAAGLHSSSVDSSITTSQRKEEDLWKTWIAGLQNQKQQMQ